MIRDSIGSKITNFWNIWSLPIFSVYLKSGILVDIENFDLLAKLAKNLIFSSNFVVSDIREFFAKRKI